MRRGKGRGWRGESGQLAPEKLSREKLSPEKLASEKLLPEKLLPENFHQKNIHQESLHQKANSVGLLYSIEDTPPWSYPTIYGLRTTLPYSLIAYLYKSL